MIREIAEDTGQIIHVAKELGQLLVPEGKGGDYEIHDLLAQRIAGEALAGDY